MKILFDIIDFDSGNKLKNTVIVAKNCLTLRGKSKLTFSKQDDTQSFSIDYKWEALRLNS